MSFYKLSTLGWIVAYADSLRSAIITEKVKLLLTLYSPLPPPFLLSKAEASCSFSPIPPKVSKNCTLSGALVLGVLKSVVGLMNAPFLGLIMSWGGVMSGYQKKNIR